MMHMGRSISLRVLLAAILVVAVLAGGACVLLVGSEDAAETARRSEADVRRTANLISERLSEELATVGRDVSLAAENTVLGREGNGTTVQQVLGRWRALHPGYADILVADRSGRVLVTASGSLAGADVSGTTWFSRGLSGIVIGDASDRTRTGGDVPPNVIIGAPVRAGGTTEIGVLAVQLKPDWIQEVVAALRRNLGGAARDSAIQVMNAGGRTLHRSTGLAQVGRTHEATAAIAEGAGLGWIVSVKQRDLVEDAAGAGPATFLALAAAALGAAYIGGAVGGRLGRNVQRIADAARQDRVDLLRRDVPTADLANLADAVGACIGRSQGRERLLGESRGALARSRDRVRSARLLGGFTSWEVDLRNGQVTWADGAAAAVENAAERACTLEEMLARIEVDDRALLKNTMRAVCEEPGSIREAVIRSLAGPEDSAGRRLVLRLTAVALNGQPVRLHALTREIAQVALPAPSTGSVAPGAVLAEVGEPPAAFPAQAIVAGIAHDIGGALDAIWADLRDIENEAAFADDNAMETARRDVARGSALLKRMLALVQPDSPVVQNGDAARVVTETVDFIRAAILPGLVLTPWAGTLPKLACGIRELEVALLNVASDARASLPTDAIVTLSVEEASDHGDAQIGLRARFSAPDGFRADRGVAAVRGQMDAIGGAIGVATANAGITITLTFPIARESLVPSDPAREAEQVLLVEPDAVLRASTAESLIGRGYAVTPVASTEEASEALAVSRAYTVLLCAHAMPAVDGVFLADVVSRTHPATAIVLMAPDAIPLRGDAAVQTLRKPFSSQDLVDALAGATKPSRRADAA